MSKASDDNRGDRSGKQLADKHKKRVAKACSKVRAELPNVSPESKRLLCEALADYRQELYTYRDEPALETPWEERGVDGLDELLSKTKTVKEPIPWHKTATREVERPLVYSIDPNLLLEIAIELNAIYKELGFGPAIETPTPHDESDHSDLKGLLRQRGQDGAIEQLPGESND